MKAITPGDMRWLKDNFPNLNCDAGRRKIEGELDFCASLDKLSRKLRIERNERDRSVRQSSFFIADVYDVEIRFDSESLSANGWPTVFEVGGRHERISRKCEVRTVDLHFYTGDDSCCLGIRYSRDKSLTIRRFLDELVIPFFYRLSFVERHGLAAAREYLWREHPHGKVGRQAHRTHMLEVAKASKGRNKPCPCQSGRNYKNCCLIEVQHLDLEHLVTSSNGA